MNSIILGPNNVGAHQDRDESNCGPALEAFQSTSQASKWLYEDISQKRHPREFHHEQQREKSNSHGEAGLGEITLLLFVHMCLSLLTVWPHGSNNCNIAKLCATDRRLRSLPHGSSRPPPQL